MLNVVAVMGRLARDPELRQTMTGKSVAAFRIACDRGYKGQDGRSQADWLDVVAWDKLAEFVCRYFAKGQMIAVSGRLQTRSYQDKNGNNRTAVEIVARTLDFCGGKAESGGAPAVSPAPAGPVVTGQSYEGNDDFALVEDDGDLPF